LKLLVSVRLGVYTNETRYIIQSIYNFGIKTEICRTSFWIVDGLHKKMTTRRPESGDLLLIDYFTTLQDPR